MVGKESWSVAQVCRTNLHLYIKVLCASVIGAVLFSLSIPARYISRATISIDANDKNPLGKGNFINDLQSLLSPSESNVLTEPYVYLKILASPSFRQGLLNVKVQSKSPKSTKTYAEHLIQDTRLPWWEELLGNRNVEEMATQNIRYEMKMKTGLIIIEVSDQDPTIANAMADTIVDHLHSFMTAHMINKAQVHYRNKVRERQKAASDYKTAMKAYTTYANANTDLLQPDATIRLEALESEMDRTLSIYNEATIAWKMAQMEIQRRRPTFFKIVTNTVAQQPSNPKWLQNILIWIFYGMLFTTWYVLYRKRWKEYRDTRKEIELK